MKNFVLPAGFGQLFSVSFKMLFGEFAKMFPLAAVFCVINLINMLPSIIPEGYKTGLLYGAAVFFRQNAAGLEIAYYILTLFFYPVIFGIYAHITSARLSGSAVSFKAALKKGTGSYWKLFLIYAMYQLVVYAVNSYTYWLNPAGMSALKTVFFLFISAPSTILLGLALPFSLMCAVENAGSPFKSVADGFLLLFKSGLWQNLGKMFLNGLCLFLPLYVFVFILFATPGAVSFIIPLPVVLAILLMLLLVFSGIMGQSIVFMQLLYRNALALRDNAQ